MPPKDPFQHHTKIYFFLFQSFNQIVCLGWEVYSYHGDDHQICFLGCDATLLRR